MADVSRRQLVTLAGSGIVGTAVGLGVATQIRGLDGGQLEMRTTSEVPEGTAIEIEVRVHLRNGRTFSQWVYPEGGDEHHRLYKFSELLDRLASLTAVVEMRAENPTTRPRLKTPVEFARVDE